MRKNLELAHKQYTTLPKVGMSEQEFHISVAKYLDIALPKWCIYTTIAHGGGGHTRGKILKAMGLKPGWPDIIILRPTRWNVPEIEFIGLELKTDKGQLSEAQKQVHAMIRAVGGHVHVCRSLQEVEGVLCAHNIPLSAKTT